MIVRIAVLVVLAGVTCSAHAAQRPNILLLVAEDLSPRLGSYGDTLAVTPNIDALAARGTRYTHAFTTAGVCAPSRAALITGQHQISFGAQHMRTSTGPLGEYYAQPDPQVRAFPELLRASGYFTFTDRKLDYQFSGVRAGSGPFTLWDVDGANDDAWRQRAPKQPFFGLINFLETHESGVMRADGKPHSASHKATQAMRNNNGLVAPSVTQAAAVELPPYYPDLPEVRADIARHYDNIRMMDTRVGKILDNLRADGLLEDTIVIWTSDHGDGLPRAKRELLDSGIRVPLIVYIPAKWRTAETHPAGTDETDTRLVSFVDLAPTILQLAGAATPGYLHGQSIFTSKRRYIYASRDRIDEIMDRQRAIRSKRFKYIRSWHPDVPGGHPLAYRDNLDMVRAWRAAWSAGQLSPRQARWFEPAGEEQLYDLDHDPFELNNLASEAGQADTLQQLRTALETFLQRVGDTGELPEQQLRQTLLVNDAVPVTPVPSATASGDRLTLSSEVGASIGYRLAGERRWRLYTQPIPARDITAKAVRYGWRESAEVKLP